MQTIEDDIRAESMVMPQTFDVNGLDENAVITCVRGVQENRP